MIGLAVLNLSVFVYLKCLEGPGPWLPPGLRPCSEEQGEINVQMARRELVELFPDKIYVIFIALPFFILG